ncbi:MAG: peptide chain release factor 1 [Candidatus Staskawiczbacteria bacterium RIFOXYC1_FULL_37_43]|nr:MAG: peptide chain release factor 1 [Candidatus Staskawiczbacteria bacterium RIFCSPHIGHO2_01_FULL_37_17]OGZ71844.1 MAG: peptide chain release factor 1 [Candidatus Staskawiczbacteria bacterium RIFCSPLOWO2_01_FULL_37_19]OGZ76059.1 MAG: peptide chain release factor 1 [Candidatus Staskawiczbacteria bacterium RIFOXYA1_FULL_37_15]OGZ76957.1 MAG: peptide chain release factor 1 [Candidatus Staskawiczbacteria bacterium RIFOXYA12_FULL_37_10]OGZ80026.1 MAG: peptide chain release factor 1 [Candidatus St
MEQDFSQFTPEDWKNYRPEPESSSSPAGSSGRLSQQAVIIEIRAGTGGDEAGLFAADLYRMYSKYAQSRGWKQRVLDSSASTIGGYKEIVFEISGAGAYDNLQNEGGVHRVQRVPETEKQGRVHTSTATVAVLLKPKKTEINISPADLEISTYKASGPGGQYVNKTESAVRIAHKPSGLVVTCQSERNQLQNKETAMALLSARLLQKQEESDLSKLTEERREQIGWAKRSEKIRTYNYPQNRITDHRINKSWHNLESILNGNLEPIIKTFRK